MVVIKSFSLSTIILLALFTFLTLGTIDASHNSLSISHYKHHDRSRFEIFFTRHNNLFSENDTKIRELHFFWTSGRRLDDMKKIFNTENALPKVYIGGSKLMEENFFYYMKYFLKYLEKYKYSERIKVRLVVDNLTLITNQEALRNLNKVGLRIVLLANFVSKIKKIIPEKSYALNSIFANASAGNPAIASDIYRLIHPIIRFKSKNNAITKIIFTYCDIDTFVKNVKKNKNSKPGQNNQNHEECFHFLHSILDTTICEEFQFNPMKYIRYSENSEQIIAQKNGAKYKENISKEQSYQDFLIIKGERVNDVIMIKVKNKLSYYNFVINILDSINTNKIKRYNLKYIHTINQSKDQLIANIKDSMKTTLIGVFNIVSLTGPAFLSIIQKSMEKNFISSLKYKLTFTGSWFNSHQLIKDTKILDVNVFNKSFIPKEQIEKINKFYQDNMIEYIAIIDAANYTKKTIGTSNKLFYELMQQAKANPLISEKFKEIIREIITDNNFKSNILKQIKSLNNHKYITHTATSLTNQNKDNISKDNEIKMFVLKKVNEQKHNFFERISIELGKLDIKYTFADSMDIESVNSS